MKHRFINVHSLRARILIAFTGLILIGFAALTAFAGQQLSAGTTNDFKERMIEQAQLIARGLKEPVEHLAEGEGSATAIEGALQEYANQFGIEVTLLQGNGRYLLGSPLSSTLSPENAPEVTTARLGQTGENTRSDPSGQQTVYTAAPIYEDGQIMAIIHLAAPLAGAQSLIWQRWSILIGGVLILAGLAIGVSLWLSSSLTRPLSQLQTSAEKIAQGDFSQRLPEDRQDEIGQLAGAFNHMTSQVEAMIEEQRTFAGNASHELRTPLTTIRLRSEALRDGVLDEETSRQYIIEIDDEVTRLSGLVEDLILISRLDSGRLQAGHEEIDPIRFIQHLAQEFDPLLTEKALRLDLTLPDHLPAIQASLSHLQVVFRNILTNTIKYTPPSGHISWLVSNQSGYFHSVITDTGQGIAPEDLPHLFERFYRTDKAHSREIPGVGLGLSLVKMIVEFYGGSIEISSPGLNQGTTVIIQWPFSVPLENN
jgi:two-component system OmpR family sensor kinase